MEGGADRKGRGGAVQHHNRGDSPDRRGRGRMHWGGRREMPYAGESAGAALRPDIPRQHLWKYPLCKVALNLQVVLLQSSRSLYLHSHHPRDLAGDASGQCPMRQSTPRAHRSGVSECRAASRRARGRLMRPHAPSRAPRSLSQRVARPPARAMLPPLVELPRARTIDKRAIFLVHTHNVTI